MVKFLQDKIVTPIETSWFGFYETGSDKKVLSLFESSFYTSDRLGLKQMMMEGKLVFMEVKKEFLTGDKLLLNCQFPIRLTMNTSRFQMSGLRKKLSPI